jgi:4-hydroxy-4-methyl-2-oxoglutarate aldolase
MINDPPLLTIKRVWSRPDAALLSRLKGAQTGHIIDAMEGRGALDHAIKPLDSGNASFVGTAITAETFANDNLAIAAALSFVKPGDVIVAASDGFSRTAVVGDNVCLLAKNAGAVAIVIDGMARDLDGILPVALPVFARGITPNSCVRSGPGKVGLPIVAGGVAIQSGDVILGDRDGVVVIPQGNLAAVVAALDDIRRVEGETQAMIRAGLKTLPSVAELLKSDRVRYVD